MRSYDYLAPDGTKADKRRWPIGTPVTVTWRDGATLKSVTTSVPLLFPSGGWAVGVKGAPAVVALDRVTLRYQADLLAPGPEGVSESDQVR